MNRNGIVQSIPAVLFQCGAWRKKGRSFALWSFNVPLHVHPEMGGESRTSHQTFLVSFNKADVCRSSPSSPVKFPAGIDYSKYTVHYLCLSWCFLCILYFWQIKIVNIPCTYLWSLHFWTPNLGRIAVSQPRCHLGPKERWGDQYPTTIVREFHELLPGCLDSLYNIEIYCMYMMNIEMRTRGTFEICACHLNDPSFYFYILLQKEEVFFHNIRHFVVICFCFCTNSHEATQRL